MSDSRKGPEPALKRDLLTRLIAEVSRWDGRGKLGKKETARLGEIMSLLSRCPLYLAERNWLAVSHLWMSRASHIPKPDAWLRELWLIGLWQWQIYLDCFPLGADDPPSPPLDHDIPLPLLKPVTDPRYLPFGFVKPVM